MRKTRPYRVTKTGAGALVHKADILDVVQKAMEPIRRENAELRAIIQKKDYEEIAKSDFGEIGSPGEVATILKSMEGLPSEARKLLIKSMKQANAMKAEAGKILYHSIGSNRPAPGSSTAQFEEIVQKKQGEIRKSGEGSSDPKIMRAMAVAAATRENPQLARAVIAEERQESFRIMSGAQGVR